MTTTQSKNLELHLKSQDGNIMQPGMGFLARYLKEKGSQKLDEAVVAYLASLDVIHGAFPLIADKIVQEIKDQRENLKLIASENHASLAVHLAMGNLLTDKYAEGFPYHRFYAGCDNVDAIEDAAGKLAKELFDAEHAYVQPHSGADANLIAFWAVLYQRVQQPELKRLGKKNLAECDEALTEEIRQKSMGQRLMGMSLNSGGHLTHGFRYNLSSKIFQAFAYDVDRETGLLNYDTLSEEVKRVRPLLLIAGYSAYPRLIDFERMREIADSVGAVLLVDMAHFAGLVAGKAMKGKFNPVPYADIVTSTTHKTLRGPRGGLILCKKEFQEAVDKGCPYVAGGPLPHVMAAKAVAFKEALAPSFRDYAEQVIKNAQALATEFMKRGVHVLTGGTDNHLLLIDVSTSFGLSGLQAESVLRKAHFTTNRNSIPFDPRGAWNTSGIRLGTPALTTRGMREGEMREIASIITSLLKSTTATGSGKDEIEIAPDVLSMAQGRTKELLQAYPLYPEITLH